MADTRLENYLAHFSRGLYVDCAAFQDQAVSFGSITHSARAFEVHFAHVDSSWHHSDERVALIDTGFCRTDNFDRAKLFKFLGESVAGITENVVNKQHPG